MKNGEKNGVKITPKLRILVIDDERWVVDLVNKNPHLIKEERVIAEVCGSLTTAVSRIGLLRPTHLFLDHFLGQDSAGFEIARAFEKKVKIISTTGSKDLVEKYHKMGIEHCPKNQIPSRVQEIILEAELEAPDE